MKGGQIDPPEKTTLKKPSLIRVKPFKVAQISQSINVEWCTSYENGN